MNSEAPNDGAALDELLPEGFRRRARGGAAHAQMRHFDVQLIGGMIAARRQDRRDAHRRRQDPRRDAARVSQRAHRARRAHRHGQRLPRPARRRLDGRIYKFLGLTVGVNLPQMEQPISAAAYACDITYGTNNEFGFDYLRDNMAMHVRSACSAACTSPSSTRWTRS